MLSSEISDQQILVEVLGAKTEGSARNFVVCMRGKSNIIDKHLPDPIS